MLLADRVNDETWRERETGQKGEQIREIFVTIVPGIVRFFQIVPVLTIAFGLLLLYNVTGGDLSQINFSTAWGMEIILGMALALVAFVLSEAVSAPAVLKQIALNRRASAESEGDPLEMKRLERRATVSSAVVGALLLVTLAFMVAVGFY